MFLLIIIYIYVQNIRIIEKYWSNMFLTLQILINCMKSFGIHLDLCKSKPGFWQILAVAIFFLPFHPLSFSLAAILHLLISEAYRVRWILITYQELEKWQRNLSPHWPRDGKHSRHVETRTTTSSRDVVG